MPRRFTPILIVVASLCTLAALVVTARCASAHGEAHWIEANKRYVSESGSHCRGVVRCIFKPTTGG
jgi:hypothetical protein